MVVLSGVGFGGSPDTRHMPSRIIRARRCVLVTSRRVRHRQQSPCASTTAPSSGSSQANFCAVAGSIEPDPLDMAPHQQVWTFPQERLQVLCGDVHHHQGAVLTRTVLRCGVQEHPRHIQQRIRIAV